MCYINVDNLFKLPNPLMLPLLLVLKQATKKDVSDQVACLAMSDEDLDELEKGGYIKYIQGKKTQSIIHRMRLDKKGTAFLNTLQDPEITENDIAMFNHLCTMYLDHEDEERHIGNKKKTLEYCAEFRQLMELGIYEMYWLCWFFLQEHSFTKKLEYIFFNSNKHRYGTFKGNLADSPLYQFLDERREEVEKFWEQKITKK